MDRLLQYYSTLLLPVDQDINMHHSFGQVILTVLTTLQTIFPATSSPKTSRLLKIHRDDLRNGWDLLWNSLHKSSPHLGGMNDNVHDLISALTIIPHEMLPEFYNHVLNLQNTIIYSQASVPPTCLMSRFINQLMTCPDLCPFLAQKKAGLKAHIQCFGENPTYTLESIQTIFDHLEDVEAPQELKTMMNW
eukprot:scaffold137740_cov50-Attheya_sp.AAC.2